MMKAKNFVSIAKEIATKYKTLYVMGCFGAPLNDKNKARYTTNHSYNKQKTRTQMIKNASSDTFGFDCVCLIKGILWGWKGDKSKTYGGATYVSNGVPDIDANAIITNSYSYDISTNFSNIIPGEIVWMKGHVGIYIGDQKVVECTPAWNNKVQITTLNMRKWKKHGKLRFVDYECEEVHKSVTEIAKEVIAGKWGNDKARKKALEKAGYNYKEVQAKVNELLAPKEKIVYHVVKKGDTLWGIAKKYLGNGLKYGTIKKLNGLSSSKIYPGQKLRVK